MTNGTFSCLSVTHIYCVTVKPSHDGHLKTLTTRNHWFSRFFVSSSSLL